MGERKSKKQRERRIAYFDYNLLLLVVFLIGFGMVMLYSSSSYVAANKFGDAAYYLNKQIRNAGIGAVLMIATIFIPYTFWKRFGLFAYVASMGLCLLTYVPQFQVSANGSSRWIKIGPLSFQPSEVAKIGVIIFMAMILERTAKQMHKTKNLIIMVMLLLPIIVVVALKNLSTAIIIFGIGACMIFVASKSYKQFAFLGLGAVLMVVAFSVSNYRSDRIDAWLHPETAGDKGYQTLQGLYAIGSGGLFGKGLGQSLQKMGNVPEAQNDMIFTIICEELGLFGGMCVILLFMLLIWRMMVIANNAQDLFGALIVVGVMSHVAIQVILNIAVVTNTIPNTGVILPFISYGGTSFAFLMAEMGLVLGVSRGIRKEKLKERS
ncbi:MAG: cell division protein FtsW [Agathobacter sp.]|nr:cell division protein FtsW [Agathobacter sp.]